MKRIVRGGLLLMTWLALGCSAQRLATHQAAALAVSALPAYDRETDIELAEEAVASQLKFLDGLLESAPHDQALLLAAARSYARYTHGFVELRVLRAETRGDTASARRLRSRAARLYGRAEAYAVRALTEAGRTPPDFESGTAEALIRWLGATRTADAPSLFWLAFARGSREVQEVLDPATLQVLARSAQVMHRVVRLDPGIEAGSAHLFLGVYYSRVPALFGGDPRRAEENFVAASAIGEGRYLPARLMQALYRASWQRDRRRHLEAVATAPNDLWPERGLDNAIARRKAILYIGTGPDPAEGPPS